MSYKRIFFAVLLAVMTTIMPSCDRVTPENDQKVAEDVRFILREDVIDLNSASIRVRHNGGADAMWCLMQTDDLVSDADELISQRVLDELKYNGQVSANKGSNKSVSLFGLEAKKSYRVIVKAIDADGNLYGNAASLVFKTRRDPDVWEVNDKWTLTRNDKRSESTASGSNEIVEFEDFNCTSNDEEAYIVLTLKKADFQAYKKEDGHKDKKRTLFEDYHADFISSSDYKSRILKGNRTWKEERLRSGEYVVFMIGLDEDDELSGLYRQFNITIEPEEPTEAYSNWLGLWEVSFTDGSTPWLVKITTLDSNMWLSSVGWEPEYSLLDVTNLNLPLYFSKGSGDVYFVSQEVAQGSDGSVMYYYGAFHYNQYMTFLPDLNLRIAKARFTNLTSTEAVIDPMKINIPGVGEVEFVHGLFYNRNSGGGMAVSLDIPELPWTMKKIVE
jgi:hypothetical protein